MTVDEIVEAAYGHRPGKTLVRDSHPHAAKKRWAKRRIMEWMAGDPEFVSYLHHEGQAIMNSYLMPTLHGVGKRASRGRPDAAKMVMGSTGFYNDKVNHDHSGEININVSIPRPTQTQDQLGPGKSEESFVDAEVVEDE